MTKLVDIERDAIRRESQRDRKPEKPTGPRFPVMSVDELCAPPVPIHYLLEALDLCPGPPAMLSGYGFSMKTLAAQSLLISIVLGQQAWGHFDLRPGPVAHIDHEQGRELTKQRYQRLVRASGADMREVAPHLRISPTPRIYLNTPRAEEAYLHLVDGTAAFLVDSFRAACPGEDENDSNIRRFLDMLHHVSEKTGSCGLVVHHAGKSSPEDGRMAARGSAGLYDAVGSAMVFTSEKKGDPVKVKHEKARSHGILQPTFELAAADLDLGDGNPRGGLRVSYQELGQVGPAKSQDKFDALLEKVRRVLREHPGIGKRQLRARAQGNASSIDAAVEVLLERNEVVDLGSLNGARKDHSFRLR